MKSLRISLWCIGALAMTSAVVQAQFGEKERDVTTLKPQAPAAAAVQLSAVPALDGPVDPDRYVVGPADVFQVGIWTTPPTLFTLTVTPEGTFVIPGVGEVRVSDLSLTAAKQRVLGELKKKYLASSLTVTLMTPRKVLVSVSGAVFYPGRYTLNATDRVDRAIAQANEFQRDRTTPFIDQEEMRAAPWQKQSVRNIRVRHRTGDATRADLQRFMATQDQAWNPYVRDGDEIFVPRAERTVDVVAVYGGVNRPGRFEFVAGDSLTDIIDLAYGMTPRAIRDSIVVSRYAQSSDHLDLIEANIDSIRLGSRPNLALQPGDRIVVRERPELRRDYRASIDGEVRYPGTYPITRERTKLTTLISLAGGFTEFASIRNAQVYRASVAPQDIYMERMLSSRGNVTPEDSAYFVLETELRLQREVVSVDLERLIVGKDSSQDVVLQTDDRVYVPSIRRTVYVFGQVVVPGNVPFVPGERVGYYLQKAGGTTDNARSGDVVIIKNTTRQWLSPGETTIEEGDQVWVPKEPYRPFSYYMAIIGQTASILGVAISIVLLVIQVRK